LGIILFIDIQNSEGLVIRVEGNMLAFFEPGV
jgi:hypothetical protein